MFCTGLRQIDTLSNPLRGLALGLVAVMPFWAGAVVLFRSLLG